jgi:uncharacterized protein YrzB (UPF0473 family)
MENKEFAPDIITLIDDEGVEQEFEIVDSMEFEDEYYYALVPFYKDGEELLEGDGELVVLKSVEENGEEILATIDDDDEYDKVGAIFLERLADLYEDEEELQ